MPKDCRFCEYEISSDAFALCQLRTNEGQNFKLMDTREEKDVFFDLIFVLDVIERLEDYFSARPLVAAEIRCGVPGAEVRATDKPNRRRRWRKKRWFQAKILHEWVNFRRATAGDTDSAMLQ